MIRFERVSRAYAAPGGAAGAPATYALRDLDLEVRPGETLALIGASGSGKTTTLRLANRLVEPSAGRVLFEGADVASLDPVGLRRRMGYVVQSGGLLPHLTVARNVCLLGELEGWSRSRLRGRVDELLGLVQLDPGRFRERFPAELSGGQRQRVGVARALFLDPEVLLLDEPFGALDPITRGELQREFAALSDRVSKTVLLVSHDLEEAFRLGDRVALLERGRLVQVGTPDELRDAPRSEHVRRFVEEGSRAG